MLGFCTLSSQAISSLPEVDNVFSAEERVPSSYLWDYFGIFAVVGDSNSIEPYQGYAVDDFPIQGAKIYSVRTEPLVNTTTAALAHDFANDFIYNRVWLEPSTFDAGFIFSDKQEDVHLWNAYTDQSISVDEIAALDAGGSGLSGISEGAVLAPTEEITFTATAYKMGTPNLSDSYVFYTSDGSELTFAIIGVRIVVFPFPPQGDGQYLETYSWLTDVMRKYAGKEQRVRTRIDPRISQEMTAFATTKQDQAVMNNLLTGWHPYDFGMPVWGEERKVPAAILAGSTTVVADTRYGDFKAGWAAILISSTTKYEPLNVESVSEGFLTLAEGCPVVFDYPAGATLIPLRLCSLRQEYERVTFATGLSSNKVFFDYYAADYAPAFTELRQHGGYDVLEVRPLVSGTLSEQARREMFVLDAETGVVNRNDRFGYQDESKALQLVLNTRQKVWEFKGWLASVAGRTKPFWAPTWRSDIVITKPLVLGQAVIYVENTGYAKFIKQNVRRRTLYMLHKSGVSFIATIISSGLVDDTEEWLELDIAFDFEVAVGDFTCISFLDLVRLSSDDVTMQYYKATEVVCTLPIQGVEV